MTHDELIAKINHRKITNQHLVKDLTIQQAKALISPLIVLRAVVELHKPWNNGDKDICQECANLIDPWSENCYPCPTIQAIEKELA